MTTLVSIRAHASSSYKILVVGNCGCSSRIVQHTTFHNTLRCVVVNRKRNMLGSVREWGCGYSFQNDHPVTYRNHLYIHVLSGIIFQNNIYTLVSYRRARKWWNVRIGRKSVEFCSHIEININRTGFFAMMLIAP